MISRMAEVDRKLRRLATASGGATLALFVFIAGCSRETEPEEPAAPPPPAVTPKPAPPIPPITPTPPLGRSELIAAVQAATSAHAAGRPYPQDGADLVGRQFELKLPFGCRGPEPQGRPATYTINPRQDTIRLSARPEVWTDAAWVRDLVGAEEAEAIEGFWIPRPWTDAEVCPPERTSTASGLPAPASPETLGLARVFGAGESRVPQRGGRPYEVTQKLPPEAAAGPRDFRLVLSGRVVGFDDGQAIHCRSEDPDRRPVCLVGVEFDRVAFEDASSGEVLAEWNS